jgi:aquaporin Z
LEELLTYCVAQVAGAIAAALVLYMILSGKASGWNGALGQTTWSEYNTLSAFIFETVGTFLLLVCILGVTQRGAPVELAGIAIGLTLAAIHLVGINISGSSVNPARSLGPPWSAMPTTLKLLSRSGFISADRRGRGRLFVQIRPARRRNGDPDAWRRRVGGATRGVGTA